MVLSFVKGQGHVHLLRLVTFRAAGGELQRVLDAEEGLEEQHAARVMRQILEGLCYLHSSNIAHLDLKVSQEWELTECARTV